MAAIVPGDWTITAATKVVAYIGDDHGGASPSYSEVIEFHRWLQDLADDAVATGDDELDISKTDPSRRSTDNIITLINGYTIGATEAEHLFDGSIIQDDGDEIWDGIVNFGNASVQIQIIQDGAVLTDDWWNFGGSGLNADSAAGISHRFMIKTRTGGADVDGRRLIGICRTFGNTYSEFSINGTSRGNNVLALSDSNDLNNETAEGTVSGWTAIDNTTEGYVGIDVDNNGADEFYYSEWNKATFSINQFFERMKWLTRAGTSSTIYGINGELFRGITHEIDVTGQAATDFSAFEPISWTGGTGQMFAVDDVNAASKIWMQLLTGVAPTDAQVITGGTSGATCTVNTTVTDRSATISTPFVGVSTGSALIGAYGVGVEVADLTASDKVTDLTATVVTPPNFVQNIVSGLVSGEDRVLVAPWDGVSTDVNGDPEIDYNQLTTSGSHTNASTTVTISASVPADTPNSGTIRIEDSDGFHQRMTYTGWTGSTFTGCVGSGSWTSATASELFISYIDELASGTTASFTSVQSGTRDLLVLVRDGGASPIKQFISAWSQTSSPSTISVIRTTDA